MYTINIKDLLIMLGIFNLHTKLNITIGDCTLKIEDNKYHLETMHEYRYYAIYPVRDSNGIMTAINLETEKDDITIISPYEKD